MAGKRTSDLPVLFAILQCFQKIRVSLQTLRNTNLKRSLLQNKISSFGCTPHNLCHIDDAVGQIHIVAKSVDLLQMHCPNPVCVVFQIVIHIAVLQPGEVNIMLKENFGIQNFLQTLYNQITIQLDKLLRMIVV